MSASRTPRCQARKRRRLRRSLRSIFPMRNWPAGFAKPVGIGYEPQIAMRPDILNPLFAEVEVLKGIGPALAKPLHRLGLNRVVDILFHLPVGWIDRKRVAALDEADVGRVITIALTPRDYRQGGRGPLRIFAEDQSGD